MTDFNIKASLDEYDLIASITRDSFYEFVVEFWDTIIAEPFVDNWHIKYLCDELQVLAERVFNWQPFLYDLIINISPGSTKSTICSIMFPAWIWTRNASYRIIGASYSAHIQLSLALRGRDIIKSEKYKKCFPHISLRKDQDSKTYFMNNFGGYRYSVGVGGSVTGMHGHFLIVDDPLDPNAAVSEAELLKSNTWMTDTLPSRKVNKTIVPIILIMQRLHQKDCTAEMLNQAIDVQKSEPEGSPLRVKHICIPAVLTDNVNPPELKEYYKGGLMDPVLLPFSILNKYKVVSPYSYSGQYEQSPLPPGGFIFKTEKLIVAEDEPQKWKRNVRYWDKAGTAGGGAFTVGALIGQDMNDRFWVRDIQRGQWDSFTRETKIRQTAEMDGINIEIGIEQEPGSGGKDSAENTVKNLRGFNVFIDKPSGSDSSKEARAMPFAAQVNGGNVYLVKSDWNRNYINELSYFGGPAQYKDQVDASSGGFNRINKQAVRVGALFRRSG